MGVAGVHGCELLNRLGLMKKFAIFVLSYIVTLEQELLC